MISEKKPTITEVINELEVVLKSTKEKEHSVRLRRAIDILRKHTITLNVKGTAITLFTEDVEDIQVEDNYAPRPVATVLFSDSIEEDGVKFVDTKVVADYYGVTTETVRNWIKDGKISGKQLSGHRGKWFIPAEEFEFLKKQREKDTTDEDIKEVLREDYSDDLEFELEE